MRRLFLLTSSLFILFAFHAKADTNPLFPLSSSSSIPASLTGNESLVTPFHFLENQHVLAALGALAIPEIQPVVKTTEQALNDYAGAAGLLINEGMSHVGVRYRYGSDSPENGLDCSGLVLYVFRTALGLDLPRTARSMSTMGTRVSKNNLKPGDLVFFNTMRRAFSHVGIYIGNGQFLHAPARGGKVRVDSFSSYWTKRFNGARRVIEPTRLPSI